MKTDPSTEIRIFTPDELEFRLPELGALLHACVHAGASISFVLPFSQREAEAFWLDKVLPCVRSGTLALLVFLKDGRIAGTVQLDHDTPPNQPHRAEVRKLLVHPDFRNQGIARQLMQALEKQATMIKRNLLTLDTRTGDKAEPLYVSLDYQIAGRIPDFCRDTFTERLDATTIMYKMLG